MPDRVRVFVTTYRRPALLARALTSLRKQTLTDWICELHNDDPTDPAPAELVAQLGDARIKLVTHARNLGALETFNLVFRATVEPFYTLLEDDNWWEPRFLEALVAALEQRPTVTVAWCNQRIWRESADGSWSDTGDFVRPDHQGSGPQLVPWGQPRQALGAVHSNGAMVVRSRPGEMFPVTKVPFTGVELARERQLPHPLLYVPEPLAHYALTRQTARANERSDWFGFQTAALATFVRHASLDDTGHRALWSQYARNTPPPTNVFLCAALGTRECRPFLRCARVADWLRLARSSARHPRSIWRAIRVRSHRPHWWETLDRHTAARFAERQRAA